MAGDVQAIRIDEAAMVVHGLTSKGEVAVRLHPAGRPDQYLRKVREFLAGFAVGSPGGYPVHLRRWTRMGQARSEGIEKLLLFGEPEAVVSVAYSAALTDELARRVWWIMPDSANARRMLERECVVKGSMGRVLVDHLVEFLPFENEPYVIIDTVKLVLKSGLADDEMRKKLWKKGKYDNAYYVGFLAALPDDLPEQDPPRAEFGEMMQDGEDACCRQLSRTLSGPGQTFLRVAAEVLDRPADRDVVIYTLDALAAYFSPVAGTKPEGRENFTAEWEAMTRLAAMDSRIAHHVLSRTTAVGTLLRQKLDPVLSEVFSTIATLRGKPLISGSRRRRS